MYDENAPKLVGNGYHGVPIEPGTKKPGQYCGGQFVGIPNWQMCATPVPSPQPGAGIGVRVGGGLVCVDYDDDEHVDALSAVFGPSPVNKHGQTAYSAFFRTDKPVANTNYYTTDGKLVLQILGERKQTVLPPTNHEDTGLPYQWCNGRSLYDTPLSELPLLTDGFHEKILALGYVAAKPRPKPDESFDPETGEIQNGFGDNPCAELNAAALKNLPAWVMSLLPDAKRRSGRYPAYDAVAYWRPSSTGRPLEQRNRNLGIVGSGIKDFGADKSYSPLDLVMAVRNTSLAEAFCWLEEKLLPQKPGPEVDWDKITEAQDAPKTVPGDDDELDGDMTEAEEAMLGPAWEFGDPIPQEEPMLVPVFIPARPLLGFFGGQRSTFKTFVTNDLTVAVASGGEFGGQKVSYPGLVVQIELEGSLSRVRVTAAALHRGVTEKLPIWQFTRTPPPILINRRLNPEWKKWVDVFVRVAKRKAAKLGLPLALITMDPAMYFAGVDDNNSWSQWTDVCKALIVLAQKCGCPVLVVDHYGKDEERGLVGSAAKEAAAHFVLGSGGERENRKNRELQVRKMKDGQGYICVDFSLDTYDVTLSKKEVGDDGTVNVEQQTHTTLVIDWGYEIRPIDASSSRNADGDHLSELQRTAMIKLITLINADNCLRHPKLLDLNSRSNPLLRPRTA